MNEEHFKFYWLYILDLKNLMVEKKLGQVANPTCTERQRLIVKPEALGVTSAMLGVRKDSEYINVESLISGLEKATLNPVVQGCTCSRKCVTVTCPCKKALKLCDSYCHPKNVKCVNI